jgi:hypothetical protein
MRTLLILLLILPTTASAATVRYTAASPFTPAYLEDFEDGKLDLPGVTATSGYLDRVSGPLVGAANGTFGPTATWVQYSIPPVFRTGLRFDFDEPVAAMGFLLTEFPSDSVALRLLEGDGTKTLFAKPLAELTLPVFIGVESTVGIAALQITSHTEDVLPVFQIDNLQVVPEPSALVLALLAFCLAARRAKR